MARGQVARRAAPDVHLIAAGTRKCDLGCATPATRACTTRPFVSRRRSRRMDGRGDALVHVKGGHCIVRLGLDLGVRLVLGVSFGLGLLGVGAGGMVKWREATKGSRGFSGNVLSLFSRLLFSLDAPSPPAIRPSRALLRCDERGVVGRADGPVLHGRAARRGAARGDMVRLQGLRRHPHQAPARLRRRPPGVETIPAGFGERRTGANGR